MKYVRVAQRRDRVILLSTHSMDEADATADRIAIMVHGTLKACGDSMVLKSKYGLGHRLHCIRAPLAPDAAQPAPTEAAPFPSDKLEECVRRHVPAAKVVSVSSAEVTFQLGAPDAPGAEGSKVLVIASCCALRITDITCVLFMAARRSSRRCCARSTPL